MRLNFSGKHYKAVAYEVDRETMRIEPEKVREAALAERPRVIIAGWSAYPRHLDFQAFRDIADEVGAALWVDMAHFAGLVAAGLHPNPVPYADVVTTTVHKTLGGPRSGMILSSRGEQWGKKLNTAVFPGQQGGPLMHVIAAKAIAMKVAQTEEFKDRQRRTLEGAQILAERLGADDAKNAGIKLVTGGTDVHLVLVDLVESELNGQQAEDLLHEVGITVNRNAVPFDPRPPAVTSGLRIGTPALATRGFDTEDFAEVADIIGTTLAQGASGSNVEVDALRARVKKLTDQAPPVRGTRAVRAPWEGSARVLDGTATAAAIKAELKERVDRLREVGVVPGLGTILVGEDPGSVAYVAGKHRDCAQIGAESIRVDLPADATQEQVEAAIDQLNADSACTGYIVQLPLPRGIDTNAVLERIDPAKDADGLHPMNLGRLVLRGSGPIDSPLPCTPRAVIELVERYGIDLAGKNVCVVGRGVTVGRSIGLLLMRKEVNATVRCVSHGHD